MKCEETLELYGSDLMLVTGQGCGDYRLGTRSCQCSEATYLIHRRREELLLREEPCHVPELVVPRGNQLFHRHALDLSEVMLKRSEEQLGRAIRVGMRPAIRLGNDGVYATKLFQISRSDAQRLSCQLFLA